MHIDEHKFVELYDAYVEKVYRFIFYKTTHKQLAEDLTSKTFVRALKNIEKFDQNKGTFQAWIFRIARNIVIDYYRTKKQFTNIDDVWGLSCSDNISETAQAKESLEKVKNYLGKLTKKQQEIVILRVWENMPYKQIADIIGETEANCKMIFSRVIKKIKQDINPILALFLLITLK